MAEAGKPTIIITDGSTARGSIRVNVLGGASYEVHGNKQAIADKIQEIRDAQRK